MATDDSQRDEQWSGTLLEAIQTVVNEDRKNLHTALPGIVQEFDAAKQTARVRPAIKRVWIDEGPKDLPDCVDVPVHFPRGGGFVLTFPIAAGDECLLVFSERAIDHWLANGGTHEPAEVRFHDLSDAFAIVGFSSAGKVVSGLATDAVELRALDGGTVVRVESGTVILGAKSGAQPAVLGDDLQALLDAIKTHTHPPNSGGPVTASLELTADPTLPLDVRASKVKVK